MQTVFENDNAALPIPQEKTELVLLIPASTFRALEAAAAASRVSVEDYVIVTAWRDAAYPAHRLR